MAKSSADKQIEKINSSSEQDSIKDKALPSKSDEQPLQKEQLPLDEEKKNKKDSIRTNGLFGIVEFRESRTQRVEE